jgi:hypothetical protein
LAAGMIAPIFVSDWDDHISTCSSDLKNWMVFHV